MKNNRDRCVEELFNGLVNPNLSLSTDSSVQQESSPPVDCLINDRIRVTLQSTPQPESSAPKEKKKPGRKKTNKVNFMARLSEEYVEKLDCLASTFGIHKCDIIEEGLNYFFTKYEEKHGPINSTGKKTAADLLL